MFRIVGELLHPIAQLRHMHAQVLRSLHIGHASLLDQPHSLKLELAGKLPSLHDPPPAPSKHLTRCLRNRVQANALELGIRSLVAGTCGPCVLANILYRDFLPENCPMKTSGQVTDLDRPVLIQAADKLHYAFPPAAPTPASISVTSVCMPFIVLSSHVCALSPSMPNSLIAASNFHRTRAQCTARCSLGSATIAIAMRWMAPTVASTSSSCSGVSSSIRVTVRHCNTDT